MFNSETGNSGQSRDEILRAAQQKALEKGVGAYTIAVKADGELKEARDESELAGLFSRYSSITFHGIVVDGKGGVDQAV